MTEPTVSFHKPATFQTMAISVHHLPDGDEEVLNNICDRKENQPPYSCVVRTPDGWYVRMSAGTGYNPALLSDYSARQRLLNDTGLSLAFLEALQYAWRSQRCSAVVFEVDSPTVPELERFDGEK